jgi:hypothetical protein
MKDIIKLQSHNKTNNFLRVVQGKEYKLVTPFHTVRVTYRTDKKGILSIDPSGGPMITIGDKIDGAEVKSIFYSSK